MDYLMKDFGKILKKNALMMRRLMLKENTDCMRVYDRNLEDLPVSVELFAKYARITDYSETGLSIEMENLVKDMVRRMCYIQGENVIFHRRAKRSKKEQHGLQSEKSITLEVKEASHRFKVDLTKRIDTGLFLDHYKTRKLVQSISDNLKVLNLFSYTGSFSVYAAAGNAALVESVDLSKTYTDWAKYNLFINGYEGEKYPCITDDALKYIIDSVRNKKKYDLVIFDPPSFSNSRKMESDFDVQRDYVRYLKLINNLLENGGKVIFSTNLSTFHMDPGRLKGFDVKNVTKEILADGFTKKKGTSRTWILEKVGKAKLTKEDFEGKKYFTERKTEKRKRKNTMDEIQKTEENNFEKIIANLEESYQENDIVSDNAEFEVVDSNIEINEDKEAETTVERDDDSLVIHWDDSYEPKKSPRRNNSPRGDRRPSRDSRDRSFSRDRDDRRQSRGREYSRDNWDRNSSFDRIEKSFTRSDEDRRGSRDRDDRRPSRDNRDRSFSRDRDDRRPSRDNRDRSFSRDRDDRRPSRDNRDRSFSRDRDDSRPSRDNRDRSFLRDRDDRRPSRDNRDRSFSRDRDDRRPSRDNRDRSFSRDRDDRRPSRDNRDRSFSRDRDDRRPSRDNRDRSFSRDRDDRSFSRDNRDRKYSRDDRDRRNNRDRSFSRDDRDRRSPRDDDNRSFSRDNNSTYNDRYSTSDRDKTSVKRVKGSKPKPYGFEKKNKQRNDEAY